MLMIRFKYSETGVHALGTIQYEREATIEPYIIVPDKIL